MFLKIKAIITNVQLIPYRVLIIIITFKFISNSVMERINTQTSNLNNQRVETSNDLLD